MVDVTNRNAWMLFLLSSIYMVGELGHFLIGTVSRSIAQDLHYGDLSCFPQPGVKNVNISFCDTANTSSLCQLMTLQGGNITACVWDYNGLGLDYQWLAGPSYIVAFTIAGIFWGIGADWFNRVNLLAIGTLIFSIAMVLTAFITKYWQLVLLRALLAIGEASCSPLAAGMISDTFPQKQRALAMSLFNWGIYIGYGFSYAVGNYITEADVLGQGWRASYVFSGAPGILIAIIFFLSVRDPEKNSSEPECKKSEEIIQGETNVGSTPTPSQDDGNYGTMETITDDNNFPEFKGYWSTWKSCISPLILVLGLAACIRHTAGYCWGYNSALYFQKYYPDYDAGWWLTCISIFGGAAGAAIGGFVSDRLVPRMGIAARALVLAGSQLLATPFTIGLLYFKPPLAFFSLLIGYLAAEMWFGVMFAILVELVPLKLRSTAIGLALFVINNVGGNLPVLVAPISSVIGLRGAITIFYPGALFTSSILFFVCCILLRGRK